jgi:hypothetical protein
MRAGSKSNAVATTCYFETFIDEWTTAIACCHRVQNWCLKTDMASAKLIGDREEDSVEMQLDESGAVLCQQLLEFRAINMMGIYSVVGFAYSSGEKIATLQLALAPDQCRQLAAHLLIQAQLSETERPTASQ